nr:SRPBCC family protein [uncultured Lichenicoccus sp.]
MRLFGPCEGIGSDPFDWSSRQPGTALLVMSILSACGVSQERLNDFAGGGRIVEDAPVKAEASIGIAALQAKVWALLSDIAHWPDWQTAIGRTSIKGAPAVGRRFQ